MWIDEGRGGGGNVAENPERARVESDNIAWMVSSGLLRQSAAEEYCGSHRIGQCAALVWPEGLYPDVTAGADMFGWFFLHEEQFDGPAGRDVRLAGEIVGELVTLAHDPARRTGSTASARAFGDLMRRFNEGMSGSWRQRHARHWSSFLNAYVTEARYRQAGEWPTLTECLAIRRHSIGMRPVFDLVERFGGFELPIGVRATSEYAALESAGVDAVLLHNDLYSAAREEQVGDVHNCVLVLRHRHGLDPQSARREVRRLHQRGLRDVGLAADAVRHTARRLALDTEGLAHTDRLTSGLEQCVRGAIAWQAAAGRYGAG